MTEARSTMFGIVEVRGYIGFWLRRRPVRYSLGANCDRIVVEGATLLVYQGKTAIASAVYRPLADVDNVPADFRWDRVMKQRDRHGR